MLAYRASSLGDAQRNTASGLRKRLFRRGTNPERRIDVQIAALELAQNQANRFADCTPLG